MISTITTRIHRLISNNKHIYSLSPPPFIATQPAFRYIISHQSLNNNITTAAPITKRIKMKHLLKVILLITMVGLIQPLSAYTDDDPTTQSTSINPHDKTIHNWPDSDNARNHERSIEDSIIKTISRKRLRTLHDIIASRPHRAGTVGDRRVVNAMVALFEALGLDVERQQLSVLLSDPISAELRIVEPIDMKLPLIENILPQDPYLNDPELSFAFNAYGKSGDVTAQIVYANYGRKEDFQQLEKWGVDCTGKIVLARYGGNYRGYKAKFAEEAGAAGLIIYADPADSGYAHGKMYPEGGWANPSYIQRGSIKTLDYEGDPLTPFVAATEDAPRLDASEVALPNIPVQPVGWNAAQEILLRMEGEQVRIDSWKGALPLTYRLTGGPKLKVRLHIEQKRELKTIENVIATLPGAVHPEQKIIIGAHHDAWAFGAADPTSGTIMVFELARVFAEQAKNGHWPDRSIVFACWDAEEYGIIGSTEWVEAHQNDLTKNAVAYINLDMAGMGLNFGASAAPSLKSLILDAAKYVPQPVKNINDNTVTITQQSVFDAWLNRANQNRPDDDKLTQPTLGNLGGGSDHIGFYCFLGIPSTGMGGHGSQGTSYHSNYDDLHWYRQVVGNDYESSAMVAGIAGLTAWRAANAPVLPYDLNRYAVDAQTHLENILTKARNTNLIRENEQLLIVEKLFSKINQFSIQSQTFQTHLTQSLDDNTLSPKQITDLNNILIQVERKWLRPEGIPGRPWFRSLYAASDEDSGYASWMLPALRYAVEHHDRKLFDEVTNWYTEVFHKLNADITRMETILNK